MGRVFSYARVSTLEQAKGYSIQGQEDAAKKAFEMRGYAAQGYAWLGTWADEGVSGSKSMMDRPAGRKMLAELKAGDVLLLPKLDRGFRKVGDFIATCEMLKQRGVVIFIIDQNLEFDPNNPITMFTLQVMSAFAELERGMIRARCGEGRAIRLSKGLSLGKCPYGYQVVGNDVKSRRFVVNHAEVDLICEAIALMSEGVASNTVAKRFDAAGRFLRGHPWRHGVKVRIVIKEARRGVLKKLGVVSEPPKRGRIPMARNARVQPDGAGVRPLPELRTDPPPGGEADPAGTGAPAPDETA